MVNKDYCIMEVLEPRTIWIPEMGYEISEYVIIGLEDHILCMPRDPKEGRYVTYEEKFSEVHMEKKKKEITKNVEKMKEQVVEMMGPPKVLVKKSKGISSTLEGSPSTIRSGRTFIPSLVSPKSSRTKSTIKAKRKESNNTLVKE